MCISSLELASTRSGIRPRPPLAPIGALGRAHGGARAALRTALRRGQPVRGRRPRRAEVASSPRVQARPDRRADLAARASAPAAQARAGPMGGRPATRGGSCRRRHRGRALRSRRRRGRRAAARRRLHAASRTTGCRMLEELHVHLDCAACRLRRSCRALGDGLDQTRLCCGARLRTHCAAEASHRGGSGASLGFGRTLGIDSRPSRGIPVPDPPAPDPYLEILAAEDPAPIVHRLRAEDPVHYVPAFGFWFLTRHDDVNASTTTRRTQPRTGAWGALRAAPRGLDAALGR